ncbi:hypothetical protein Cob_v009567 [Colletotrichum orbiculare MAFF 240422]|uniref:Uncharacterized protein n=1 Tax=Colletotrichum orbiculare (strain 104-T / ATCC 96160 / CBS 514.97 / LARS 414 / MAFF 240422) TaxID=1213857 RepID=A0A484FIQ3_COLOR|nr:hypothetical protein Cob_v009567 [Colletotrichum orbiculare MAFF 240422]
MSRTAGIATMSSLSMPGHWAPWPVKTPSRRGFSWLAAAEEEERRGDDSVFSATAASSAIVRVSLEDPTTVWRSSMSTSGRDLTNSAVVLSSFFSERSDLADSTSGRAYAADSLAFVDSDMVVVMSLLGLYSSTMAWAFVPPKP